MTTELFRRRIIERATRDLEVALDNNPYTLHAAWVSVEAFILGENDEAPWHWIVRQEGGTYAYITGGCDYTGWDCQSNVDCHQGTDLESAFRLAPAEAIDELRECYDDLHGNVLGEVTL